MAFLHLFIINKSGGTIHHRPLSARAPPIGANEGLRIGSTFHSLHAIAAEASPCKDENSDGIREIRAGGLVLECLQTVTGIKFIVTAEPGTAAEQQGGVDLARVLRDIYILYTECVLKDPFYELEMPIRSDLFVQAVDALIERAGKPSPSSSSGSSTPSKHR